jgi:hypothetical protein
MYRVNAAARAAVLSCVLLFAACGGGGGGSSTPPPPPPPATFTVGGTVSGLASNSVALRLNGGADLVVATNGNFTFPGTIANGAAYTVTVQTQPTGPTQTCALANATGNIAANVSNVTVTCTTSTYRVRGALVGLAGGSVVLRNNGGDELTLSANGAFQFATQVPSGGAYAVAVQAQPLGPPQTCVVTQGAGNVGAADITNVAVNCSINTYRVRGTLAGLAGGSVVLRNNGGDNLTLAADGTFQFATQVPSGGAYAVTVLTQPLAPSQTCVVTQGAGNVAAADVTNVAVNCTINTFAVGGTISGLNGSGLVLRNNGGNDLGVFGNGAFTFNAPIASGANYLVTVLSQPTVPFQRCAVANAGGTVLAANITNVAITCVNTYAIGGTVSGLDVAGLVLRNSGGDDLTVSANGAFAFATREILGATYSVAAVAGTPASPRHVCQVVNGAGTVNTNADVTNVEVTCEADRFAYVAHSSTVSFNGPGLVSALTMNHETGALAPIAGASTFAAANGAVQIVSDPRGRFVYVAHTAVYTTVGTVAGYSVNPATGALTPVPGSPFASGMATSSLAIDSEGMFLYATNTNSDDISGWAIQANGSLTPVPGSPYRIGDVTRPISVATTPAGQCCYIYVAHSNIGGVTQVSAYAYHQTTGALTPVAGSPYSFPAIYSPTSIYVNNSGETVWMTANGTSDITTLNLAGGAGTLSERPGSPTPTAIPCSIVQPRLSPFLFAVSWNHSRLMLFGEDPTTLLPTELDHETMFGGSYCGAATDPYGEFVYAPKFDDVADYLFGFTTGTTGSSLEPLTLNPVSPTNTYTLPAQMPRSMVIRNSRRDREVLQVSE